MKDQQMIEMLQARIDVLKRKESAHDDAISELRQEIAFLTEVRERIRCTHSEDDDD